MADVITDLTDEQIRTTWQQDTPVTMAGDDDTTDTGDATDAADGADDDASDSGGDTDGTDGDADQSDS